MTKKELLVCKKNILKCLTEDFKGNQALFDKKDGWAVFSQTDLTMIMDAVVKGLQFTHSTLSNSD